MKYFIVEIIYKVPFEQMKDIVPFHRAHLKKGYESGMLLLSGPQEPRVGGILVARGDTLDAVQAFCGIDPYAQNGVAEFRCIEFHPVSFQPAVREWIEA